MSTLDLLGDGLTLFTGPLRAAWQAAAGSIRTRVPLALRHLDELTARALGVTGGGALLVRPDGHPVGLWAREACAAPELARAVASVTGHDHQEHDRLEDARLAGWAS